MYIECSNDTYGNNCTGVCGSCFEDMSCDHVTGECVSGCDAGWNGPLCNIGTIIHDVIVSTRGIDGLLFN